MTVGKIWWFLQLRKWAVYGNRTKTKRTALWSGAEGWKCRCSYTIFLAKLLTDFWDCSQHRKILDHWPIDLGQVGLCQAETFQGSPNPPQAFSPFTQKIQQAGEPGNYARNLCAYNVGGACDYSEYRTHNQIKFLTLLDHAKVAATASVTALMVGV